MITYLHRYHAEKAFVIAVLAILFTGSALGMDLGVTGKTYAISERDISAEIKQRAKSINWKEKMATISEEAIKNFKPSNIIYLPAAIKNQVHMVDMSYTLSYDIPDGKGSILYPKGFTFNPLDYMKYKKTIVVFDGSDQKQVDWFKTSDYSKESNTLVLITDGAYYDLSREFGRQVYYLNQKIVDRFHLQAVPSVIVQKQKFMEVSEIAIKRENR